MGKQCFAPSISLRKEADQQLGAEQFPIIEYTGAPDNVVHRTSLWTPILTVPLVEPRGGKKKKKKIIPFFRQGQTI